MSKRNLTKGLNRIPGVESLKSLLHLQPPLHRRRVGGMWEQIGQLQFEFLLERGLQPHHYFMDVACGSLRGGVHFIPYLDREHYLGIDKDRSLIESGKSKELGTELYDQKQPVLVVSDTFEFEKFKARPDYALAQSLFTHLPAETINLCLKKLRPAMADEGQFLATFWEVENDSESVVDPKNAYFSFSRKQMECFGEANGWQAGYIGQWNHPRGQMMMCFRPRN